MENKTIYQKLIEVQNKIRVTKDKNNDFGKYKYRSAEMIYEGAKPLCMECGLLLTVSDEVVTMGERYYIKSTATITDGKETVTNTAYAREAEQMKGQSDPQVSGSTSSYARKYALQGLFLLDDNKDPDEMENGGKATAKPTDPAKLNTLVDLFGELPVKTQKAVLTRYKVKDIVDLPVDLWDKAIAGMSK
jgi:hypothetical protein